MSSKTIRKARIISLIFLVILIVSIESILRFIDIDKTVAYEISDPFIGFKGISKLFVESSNSKSFKTNESKLTFFNKQQFDRKKPADEYRIFCFGGSSTYGRPFDYQTSFPMWLELLLNSTKDGRKYKIINAGGISYASYRIVHLVKEALDYEPDLFVIYMGHNEFLEDRTYKDIKEIPDILAGIQTFLDRFFIYKGIRSISFHLKSKLRFNKASKGKEGLLSKEVDTILDDVKGLDYYYYNEDQRKEVISHYRYNLVRMIKMAEGSGVQVVLMTTPSNEVKFSPFKSTHKKMEKGTLDKWNTIVKMGWEAAKSGDIDKAINKYLEAVKIDGQFAQTYFDIGNLYLRNSDYINARKFFRLAKDKDACPLRALSGINNIIRDIAKKYHPYFIDIEKVLEERSPDRLLDERYFIDHLHPVIEVYQLIGEKIMEILIQNKVVVPKNGWTIESARLEYNKIISKIDTRYLAMGTANIGRVLNWARKYEESKAILERDINRYDNYFEIHYILGNTYRKLNMPDKAIKEYERALDIEPSKANVYRVLGGIYAGKGRYDKAILNYKLANTKGEDVFEVHFDLGYFYTKLGDFDKAIEEYEKALALDSKSFNVMINLGSNYEKIGENEKAMQLYAKAGTIKNSDPVLYYNMGILYDKKKDYKKAIEYYERAVKLDPRFKLASFNLAGVYSDLGRLDEAINYYRIYLDNDTNNSEVYNTLGVLYDKKEDPDSAIENYMLAMRFNDKNVNAISNMAVLYLKKGMYQKSTILFRLALNVAPGFDFAKKGLKIALEEYGVGVKNQHLGEMLQNPK